MIAKAYDRKQANDYHQTPQQQHLQEATIFEGCSIFGSLPGKDDCKLLRNQGKLRGEQNCNRDGSESKCL